MADLDAQIRALLEETKSPVAILETPAELTEAERAKLVARFKAAHLRAHEEMRVIPRSLVDRMGDALLAVLDVHHLSELFYGTGYVCTHCERSGYPREPLGDCPTRLAIAEKLGIEASE